MQHDISERANTVEVLAEAIEKTWVIEATYNKVRLELHPHQLFARRDGLFLRAFNPNKGRRHDEEASLGDFHLDGLSSIRSTGRTFKPLASFDPGLLGAADRPLFDVSPISEE